MAENKKSVLLYCDIIHTVMALEDDEAGRLFKHYLQYINDLNPESDRLTELLFEPIKQNLKRDLKKWEAELLQRSDAGKKGMEKRWGNRDNTVITKDNTVINPITNITDNVTVNVNENVKVTVKENTIEQRKLKFAWWAIDFGKLDSVIQVWLKYKKDRNENYKSMVSVEAFEKKLNKFSGGDLEIAKQVIEQSMANNWAGIFELKTASGPAQNLQNGNPRNKPESVFDHNNRVRKELYEKYGVNQQPSTEDIGFTEVPNS
jgi:hypothetical protein